MNETIILSIVGTFGTIALAINAFFLRGIYLDLGDVKIKLVEISTRSEAKEERLNKIENNEKEIFDRLNILEREVLK